MYFLTVKPVQLRAGILRGYMSQKIAHAGLSEEAISRVIEMAWEDRTPFEAIEGLYSLSEPQVIKLMQREMKPSSFRMWRERVSGRNTKHLKKRPEGIDRGYCSRQYKMPSSKRLKNCRA